SPSLFAAAAVRNFWDFSSNRSRFHRSEKKETKSSIEVDDRSRISRMARLVRVNIMRRRRVAAVIGFYLKLLSMYLSLVLR
ncbi:hypothetical protein LINPERHAP1_LOCUS14133, partial [Linum perenne]